MQNLTDLIDARIVKDQGAKSNPEIRIIPSPSGKNVRLLKFMDQGAQNLVSMRCADFMHSLTV